MLYNVSIKTFNDGKQILKIFSYPITSVRGTDIEINDKLIYEKYYSYDGEQIDIEKHMKNEKEKIIEKEERKRKSEKSSMSRTKQILYDYAYANKWDYFFTMTFDKKKVDRENYDDLTKKLKNFIDYYRKQNPNMKYLLVPELHEDKKAFHFHGLFANLDKSRLIDSGKKDKQGRTIYNIGSYNLGWTTVTEVTDSKAVSNYITKYITKEIIQVTKGKKRYWASKNLETPALKKIMMTSKEKEILIKNIEKKITYQKTIELKNDTYNNNIDIIHLKY